MATEVKMPQRGLSEESVLIAEWNVKKGDKVQVGDLLFTIETDKTTFEVESEVDGVILEVLFGEFEEVQVQEVVCIIGAEGEEITYKQNKSDFEKNSSNNNLDKKRIDEDRIDENRSDDKITINKSQLSNIKISPRAKKLASKRGIDIKYATPTGPEQRIIERDIIAILEKGPFVTSSASEEYYSTEINGIREGKIQGTGLGQRITTMNLNGTYTDKSVEYSTEIINNNESNESNVDNQKSEIQEFNDVKLSGIRKVIAKNMQNSLDTTAQLTLTSSFDATDILTFRKKVKTKKGYLGESNVSINDMILFGVSRTLELYKDLNAHFLGDKLRVFTNVHLGVAVDTDRGLMVPTIFNANKKSLSTISKEINELASDCRTGEITPEKLSGGTFTVTNLGHLGIESFTPVLNAPQTGILGVGTIVNRVIEVDGEYKFYPAMTLSLTFDHKALDGAPAARFLKDLQHNLENFTLLLAR